MTKIITWSARRCRVSCAFSRCPARGSRTSHPGYRRGTTGTSGLLGATTGRPLTTVDYDEIYDEFLKTLCCRHLHTNHARMWPKSITHDFSRNFPVDGEAADLLRNCWRANNTATSRCNGISETTRHSRHNRLLPAPTCYGLIADFGHLKLFIAIFYIFCMYVSLFFLLSIWLKNKDE